MILVKLSFTDRDGEHDVCGIEGYIIVDDLEQLTQFMDENYDVFCDEKITQIARCSKWWEEHPNKEQEAIELGLIIGESKKPYGPRKAVTGPKNVLTHWLEAQPDNDFDGYYLDWSEHQEITAEQANLLVALGVAKRI